VPERELRKTANAQPAYFQRMAIWPESCHSVFMISSGDAQREGLRVFRRLHAATGEPVMIAENLARATTQLRAQCCRVVVLDQYLLEAQPEQAAAMIDHLGTADPGACQSCDQWTGAPGAGYPPWPVERRQREELRASQAAIRKLQCELNDTITALLLSTELARETQACAGRSSKARVSAWAGERLREQLETRTKPKKPSTPSAKQFRAWVFRSALYKSLPKLFARNGCGFRSSERNGGL